MYKELKEDFLKLKRELEILQDIDKYLENETDEIEEGSRVKIFYESGESKLGRVVRFSSNKKQWLINRDGYAGTIGIPNSRIENLSIGIKGKLEKMAYSLSPKVSRLERILRNADLPKEIIDRKVINIKVTSINSHLMSPMGQTKVFFEEFNKEEVREIQLPSSVFIQLGFYQLHIEDGEILKVLPLSKEKYFELE
jgi:hypothetical protein